MFTSSFAFAGAFKPALNGSSRKSQNVAMNAYSRPVWYPGKEDELPTYLDGSLPGDYGFDPLRLGSDPELLRWFVQSELVHCRVAMAGAAGIVIPGLLTRAGILNVPEWYEAGKVYVENNSVDFGALLVTELLLCGWVEARRWQDFRDPGCMADGSFFGITDGFKGEGNGYPGGVHDPFGMAKGQDLDDLKLKEVKNGRLAMISMLGYWAQYAATGKGPIDNLFDHIADPGHVNFATNGVSVPF